MKEANSSIWTVYDLTLYLKNLIESDGHLRQIWIRGEISNFKHHSRGHMYFTLKDENSRILAVMFQGYNRFLRFNPKDGLKVIIRGEVSIYERDGQYQLYVKEMQPDGIGNLYLAFEQLKAKLAAEGLFDPTWKKSLPIFPKKIALVTSPTGAAIRDMLTTLKRRYPSAHIFVLPVLVQGEGAPSSIVTGLELANRYGGIDLIILGRGGGSIEELWAFNDERVARSIFHSQIPIISAVGHETDVTIADFVADLRAATPTAAAELAVPHIKELGDQLRGFKHRLQQVIVRKIEVERKHLQSLQRANIFRRPADRLLQYEQRLDRLTDSLKRFQRSIPQAKRTYLQYLYKRVLQTGIPRRLIQEKTKLETGKKRLVTNYDKLIQGKKIHFGYLLNQLEALSPLSILKRGYTLSFDKESRIVTSVRQISPGDSLHIQFHDGTVETTIWGIREEESIWQQNKKS